MKLDRANTKAFYAGREALLQKGAIVKNPGFGRPKYEVLTVRGSTVTVKVIPPWWIRLVNRIRRGAPPKKGEALGRYITPLAGDQLETK